MAVEKVTVMNINDSFFRLIAQTRREGNNLSAPRLSLSLDS